ncbi:hypothetical protein Droror1_Dr00018209, partial [Drosera rotundifolia]
MASSSNQTNRSTKHHKKPKISNEPSTVSNEHQPHTPNQLQSSNQYTTNPLHTNQLAHHNANPVELQPPIKPVAHFHSMKMMRDMSKQV